MLYWLRLESLYPPFGFIRVYFDFLHVTLEKEIYMYIGIRLRNEGDPDKTSINSSPSPTPTEDNLYRLVCVYFYP